MGGKTARAQRLYDHLVRVVAAGRENKIKYYDGTRRVKLSILLDIFNTEDTKSNTENHSVLIIRNIIAAFSLPFSFSLC